jgi:hypothetical protein
LYRYRRNTAFASAGAACACIKELYCITVRLAVDFTDATFLFHRKHLILDIFFLHVTKRPTIAQHPHQHTHLARSQHAYHAAPRSPSAARAEDPEWTFSHVENLLSVARRCCTRDDHWAVVRSSLDDVWVGRRRLAGGCSHCTHQERTPVCPHRSPVWKGHDPGLGDRG